MSLTDLAGPRHNPVDVVERLAASHKWTFARDADDEVTIEVAGHWSNYEVSFTWMADIEALHIACAFTCQVPEHRRAAVTELICLINEQLWVGHFDVWIADGIVMFRHALVLTGRVIPSEPQCEALLGIALDACERHFEAFQFVLYGGKSPREALASAIFETHGEA